MWSKAENLAEAKPIFARLDIAHVSKDSERIHSCC